MSASPRSERLELPGQFAGFPVRGTLLRPAPESHPRPPCVVLVHGYTAHRDHGFLPELARRCAAAGLATVRFDFSGDGRRADGSIDEAVLGRNTYRAELADLTTLRDWLRARADLDPTRLGIAGHSRGGAMALVHAAESHAAGLPYRAVATWAAMDGILRFSPERLAQWRAQGHIDVLHHTLRRRVRLQRSVLDDAEAHRTRLDVPGSAARLGAPLLVVHGRRDRAVESSCAERLAAAAATSPHGATLHWIDEAGHAFGAREPLQEIPPRLETLLTTTVRFFAQPRIGA